MINYLENEKITEKKRTDAPRWGMTADGYTLRSGAPTCWMIRLQGEKTFRRVMCIQMSNAGSCFIKVKGKRLYLNDCALDCVTESV